MARQNFNVLLIEDSSSDARLISEMLGHSRLARFTVERVKDLASALERLDRGGVDAILMDLSLPDCNGLDAFFKVQQHSPKVPIIIVSGFHDEELALTAVQQGAQDNLFKNFLDSSALERAVCYAIERVRIRVTLSDQRRILQSILDSIADGVVVVDNDGYCLLVNPAARRLVGFDSNDVPHHKWPEYYGLYRPDGVTPYPADELPLTRACRGESVKEQEVVVRHARVPDGAVISINATPLLDENGQTCGGVAVFRDITLRRLAEEQIRQLKAALE